MHVCVIILPYSLLFLFSFPNVTSMCVYLQLHILKTLFLIPSVQRHIFKYVKSLNSIVALVIAFYVSVDIDFLRMLCLKNILFRLFGIVFTLQIEEIQSY